MNSPEISVFRPDLSPARQVAALAGGVGGAKLAEGMQRVLGHALSVIVNTGDDFELHGLHISPDLDTVMYALAGLANPDTGWGVAGDAFNNLEMMARYGAEDWFRLGDRDLATHILRTKMLREGKSLEKVTRALSHALGVRAGIAPMSDAPVATMVDTDQGELAFQEYFVHRGWQPAVKSIRFAGIENARPVPSAVEAIEQAEVIIFCPSNPFVSIEPVLSVPGLRLTIQNARAARIAVSPIVGGQALKGPAAKMFRELGIEPSALAVAKRYVDLIDGFVLDKLDQAQSAEIQALGMDVLVTDTVMKTPEDRECLAREIVGWAARG